MTHNKKRNTAFLFEALVKEQVECVLKKQTKKAQLIESTIKKFFSSNSILGKELELYIALYESTQLKPDVAERLISVVKQAHEKLDESVLFAEQSKLIHFLNRNIGEKIYENFIPSYRILASINGMFNSKLPIKQRVMMEQKIKEWITAESKEEANLPIEIDNVVFQQFIKNFNEKYTNLLDEQKALLSQFILYEFGSETDFKLFVNEECKRIVKVLTDNLSKVQDESTKEVVNECLSNLKNISFKFIDESFVYSIMKYQELAREIQNEGPA